ncbi:MAG: DUF4062 domain-containing protein [Candidatus Marinimicrobia bacterium]|nr:DUF4062 domain-containing protein [Candidatus Neomarinimicrobiota bacterium]
MADRKLKIFVSSTVYGFDDILDQVYATLESFGYTVVMSKEGNLYVPAWGSNEDACLDAIEDCDLFYGIIFPRYGSGITHKEFQKAVDLNLPRWFSAHYTIEFTRKLMYQFMFNCKGNRNKFDIKPTNVLDSIKVVDMFNLVRNRWVQPFFKTPELLNFIDTQFKDINRRKTEIIGP